MGSSFSLVMLLGLMVMLNPVDSGSIIDWQWQDAHATCYGDDEGKDPDMGGACGYGDVLKQGYGIETTALSTALFNEGYSCGACYEIKCVNSPQWCKPGTIKVTATNFCPPDYSKTHDIWCNPPQKHFDLSIPMFKTIGVYKAGIIPVQYRRIPCVKQGGVKFRVNGNPYWLIVLVYNVGGVGDVCGVKIKGYQTGWLSMSKNWGQHWHLAMSLGGQGLSFEVTLSDGSTKQFYDVVPSNWGFGQDFDGKINF